MRNLNKANNKVKANGKVKYAGGCVTALIPLFLLMIFKYKQKIQNSNRVK